MNESFNLIYNDLNIENQQELTADQWLELIADRVSWFLEHDKDLLMSYLYRLDIPEEQIDKALTPIDPDPANIAIAKLIYKRQMERVATKIKYKVDPIEGWEF
jgi:hypothetical protein